MYSKGTNKNIGGRRLRACFACILFSLCSLIWTPGLIKAQDFVFSEGLYRIGYADGTVVEISHDIWDHDPVGKYDIITDAINPPLVAAADGWVRWIEEDFNVECHPGGNGEPCCWQSNNYVVIEHENGEWSGYTHMQVGSVTASGVAVGDWVTAGTIIGIEGSVGCSTGPHLHFEVSRPDTNQLPFDTIGGFLNGELLIPVTCGLYPLPSYMIDGNVYLAGPCEDACPSVVEVAGSLNFDDEFIIRASSEILTDNANEVVYASGSVVQFRSGGSIRFRPGFHAQTGTHSHAMITSCNAQN
jgi:hypothetical protein